MKEKGSKEISNTKKRDESVNRDSFCLLTLDN